MIEPMPKKIAELFFAQFYGGLHHCPPIKEWGHGWCVNAADSPATYDFDQLTRLVFMAHDQCIRVEIARCNMQFLKICIHPRERTGQMHSRHPTLNAALIAWRKHNPAPIEPEGVDHG